MAKNDQALPTLEKKTWDDFRNSGLLRFVNMFLHIFGWTIVLNIGNKSDITRYKDDYGYEYVTSESIYDAVQHLTYFITNGKLLNGEPI